MSSFKSKLPDTDLSIFSKMSALAAECNAINLAQGFPVFEVDQELKDLVSDAVQSGHNQYAPMIGYGPLLETLSEKVKSRYNRKIKTYEEITITSGATQAILTAISAFVHPGDEVIIIEPAYDCYKPAVLLNGGIVKSFELNKPDYRIYWSELEELVTNKTRLLIVNTPHNPTGQILDWDDWYQLVQIMERSPNLLILSDEVYEHIIFDGFAHESVLAHDQLWGRCMAVYSFGKTFHATGWRMGYIVAASSLMSEFRKVHQYNVFSCHMPTQVALAAYLERNPGYENLSELFQSKRELLINQVENTPLKPLACKGSYFLLLDFSDFSNLSDQEFAIWLTREVGVAVIPTSVFYTSVLDESIVRICFAKTDETLLEAGTRLKKL